MLSEPEKYELRENERPVSDHEYSGDYKEKDMRWKWGGAVVIPQRPMKSGLMIVSRDTAMRMSGGAYGKMVLGKT